MGSFLGRTTLRAYNGCVRLRDKLWSLCVAGSFGEFGSKSVISLPCRLGGTQAVSVGSGVYLGPGCWVQTLHVAGHPEPRLSIGDRTNASGTCVLSAALEIVLEPDVLLARNVYVSDHIHAYEDPSEPVHTQGLAKLAPVRIKRGAWLGQNVVVCPGVTIGSGSVVGANSVVTRDIPDYSVAVGAPARVVKQFAHAPEEEVLA